MSEHPCTIRQLLITGTARLEGRSLSPRLDVELLLAYVLGMSRLALIARSEEMVSEPLHEKLLSLLEKRRAHVPIAYLIGEKEFFGLTFKVTESVLVPRPETELLVEHTLHEIETRPRKDFRIADLGTGSGCIAVALAHTLMTRGISAKIIALDKEEKALGIAADNIRRWGVERMVELIKSSWFSELQSETAAFDIIVSNPPYIPEGSPECGPELRWEPSAALFSGKDGLTDIRAILSSARKFLAPGGVILIEIGVGQSAAITQLLKEEEFEWIAKVECIPDLAGIPRIIKLSIS